MSPTLIKVVNLVCEKYDLFGVFLIGSQNYHLDLENSDFDTVALVLPPIGNLYYGDPYITEKTIKYEEGICKIIDIRDFYKGLIKSNVNYIELLYSVDYWVKEDNYFYDLLRDNRERICRYNEKGLLNCLLGVLNSCQKAGALQKTNGNNHYSSYHMLRMCNFIHSFIEGSSIEKCFYSERIFSNEEIKFFKQNGIFLNKTKEDTEDIINKSIDIAKKYLELLNKDKNNAIFTDIRETFNSILDSHFDF